MEHRLLRDDPPERFFPGKIAVPGIPVEVVDSRHALVDFRNIYCLRRGPCSSRSFSFRKIMDNVFSATFRAVVN